VSGRFAECHLAECHFAECHLAELGVCRKWFFPPDPNPDNLTQHSADPVPNPDTDGGLFTDTGVDEQCENERQGENDCEMKTVSRVKRPENRHEF